MAKYCPEINDYVLYITCQECEEKICKKGKGENNDNRTDKSEIKD